MDLSVVYEDQKLLVINKPANVLSQGDHTGDVNVVQLCKQYLRQQASSDSPYIALLHRLDRPVSGLLMLAKDKITARQMTTMIKNRQVDKTYWTVVNHKPPINGYLEHYLTKDETRNKVTAYSEKRKDTQKAMLTYQRLAWLENKSMSLVAVHLLTGRSHQIRVQLSEEGYPVVNDLKYRAASISQNSLALHAVALRFIHPSTNKRLKLSVPPPDLIPWKYFDLNPFFRSIFNCDHGS